MARAPTVPPSAAQEEPDEEEDAKGWRSWALRSPAQGQRDRRSAAHPPSGPPSAAEGRQEQATQERRLQSALRGGQAGSLRVAVAAAFAVAVVVWDTIEIVCMITPPQECTELPANSGDVGLHKTQGITPPESCLGKKIPIITLIKTPPSAISR